MSDLSLLSTESGPNINLTPPLPPTKSWFMLRFNGVVSCGSLNIVHAANVLVIIDRNESRRQNMECLSKKVACALQKQGTAVAAFFVRQSLERPIAVDLYDLVLETLWDMEGGVQGKDAARPNVFGTGDQVYVCFERERGRSTSSY